jgi:ABC-2 type transport system ATP-binding protein
MGLINPTAGECSVLGGSLAAQPALRRRVGYLPGDFRMDSAMSGLDLFNWFGRLRGGVDRRRVDQLTFMHDPGVLILDELTTGLDPVIQR